MGHCWSGLVARSASLRKMFTIDGDGGGGGGGGGDAQSERLSFGGSFQESDNQERPGRGDLSGEIMAPGVEHTTRGELENAHGSHNGMASKTRRGLRRGLSVLSKSWRRNISKDDMKRSDSHRDFADLEVYPVPSDIGNSVGLDDYNLGFQSGDGYHHVASGEAFSTHYQQQQQQQKRLPAPSGSICNKKKQTYQRKPRLPRLFDLAHRSKNNKYARQSDDGQDMGFIEMNDIVPAHTTCNPSAYYQPQQPSRPSQSSPSHTKSRQVVYPDVRQVAGLRQSLTCSWRGTKNYKLLNPRQAIPSNGFVTLDPRKLIHGDNSSDWGGSVSSLESLHRRPDRTTPNSSIDLEWENDDEANLPPDLDNPPSLSVNDTTAETCSIALRSHASSQVSIPGLDWDSQGESADLLSLNNVPLEEAPLDFETEQLISEIEQLTSRALKETNQWNQGGQEDVPLWQRVSHHPNIDSKWTATSTTTPKPNSNQGPPERHLENLNQVSLENNNNNNISQEWASTANTAMSLS